jgi:hypothetical protein
MCKHLVLWLYAFLLLHRALVDVIIKVLNASPLSEFFVQCLIHLNFV